MNGKRQMLRHFLASIAYRTQKALRDAPEDFATFQVIPVVRTPHELLKHMTSVLVGYARTFFIGGEWWPEMLEQFDDEVSRFHDVLESLSQHLEESTFLQDMTPERMLQGPFSDAMSHARQLAMLRRFFGSPRYHPKTSLWRLLRRRTSARINLIPSVRTRNGMNRGNK